MHMSKKRNKAVAIALAVTVLGGGAAYAYWTAGGSGTGSASTSAGVDPLTAVQTSVVSGLQPGGTPQTLSGTFLNPNTAPVFVTSVTAFIASVTPASGLTCDASNYLIANGTMLVGAEAAVNDSTTWGGATITFVNSLLVNQDGCKGAVVNLAYAIV